MAKPLTTQDKPKQGWKQNPEAVQRDILRVAMKIFAEHGLSGARIDEIAAKTKTSKRMIYYYFGDKDGLYARALEAAYAQVREGEDELELGGLPAPDALAKLVGFTFDHHRANPDFIRMVMIENVHHADYLKKSKMIRTLNKPAIAQLAAIVARGEESGAFRPGVDALSLHWKISALSFFNVSNTPTFSALFGPDLFSRAGQDRLREEVVAMILAHVCNPETSR